MLVNYGGVWREKRVEVTLDTVQNLPGHQILSTKEILLFGGTRGDCFWIGQTVMADCHMTDFKGSSAGKENEAIPSPLPKRVGVAVLDWLGQEQRRR